MSLAHKYNTNTVDCSTGKGEKLKTSLELVHQYLPRNPNVNKVLPLFIVIDCASCSCFFYFRMVLSSVSVFNLVMLISIVKTTKKNTKHETI